MIGYAVSFLLGLGVGGLYPMVRRRRAPEAGPPAVELSAAVQESVTVFGEEAAALEFDASGPDATPAVLKEYRAALTAYDRASGARTEADALTALRDGRAAMIRLDARRQGRPVPIDALPPAPEASRPLPLTGTGERHVSTGHGDGRTEVLIDRPEPGRPALLEAEVTGGGNFIVQTVTRTEELTGTGDSLLSIIDEYHGRRYLPADATHLRVITDNSSDDHRWSTRIAPLSAATPLAAEHRGHGDEVLHHSGGPALLTVQFQTDSGWQVRYLCQCLRGWRDCDCRPPAWPKDTPGDWGDGVSGLGDGRRTLRLPRSGFLVVHEDYGGGSWYLTTQPVDIPPQPSRPRRGRRR
ncbi:hypothetical protein [Streptomyces cupreus]|uniref:Uncharacterized protein n=1 Tax=Streptomyces cupreus TaxID=2759956 RepID=A0A7X1IYP7_9ACTN|nr:hypothetical protein [Streptomyces cupreus]MBC2900107.1 hypothetical protein [Streptomyces cupreus]